MKFSIDRDVLTNALWILSGLGLSTRRKPFSDLMLH